MSGYVSTKELKDVPKKTWFAESDAERLQRHAAMLDMTESALLRKAALLMLARIEKEGYTALFAD